jgi:hypothetical protein
MPDIAINGERDILSVRIDAVTDEVVAADAVL